MASYMQIPVEIIGPRHYEQRFAENTTIGQIHQDLGLAGKLAAEQNGKKVVLDPNLPIAQLGQKGNVKLYEIVAVVGGCE